MKHSRRTVLAGAAASSLCAGSHAKLATQDPANPSCNAGKRMVELAKDWLRLLNEDQHARAVFAFDSPVRRQWNYMLGSAFANGLALENMSAEQKDAALALLSHALSASGFRSAQNIMLQQDILRDEWNKGSPGRNKERFSLQIYGLPSASGPWSWRFEGHHLTITFTLMGDEIISQTPKAFSSEPNKVPTGPYQGLVVLPENETLGRALFRNLSPAKKKAALIRDRSYGNILAVPGQETSITQKKGVLLGDLTASEKEIVLRLMDLYLKDHLAYPLADAQQIRLQQDNESTVRFGWAGANEENQSIYYRIHGNTFLIEFATLRRQPLHHHTIVHDLYRNFGDHLLG